MEFANKVNVLGTEYEIIIDAPEEMMPEDADGAMDQTLKRIMVAKIEPNRNTVKNLSEYRKKVLRHEITHAFMYESGVWNNSGISEAWGKDETITDWIAIQSPKLFKAFSEVGCLENETKAMPLDDMQKIIRDKGIIPIETFVKEASEEVATNAAQPVIIPHDYRDIKIADSTTVTIDVEEFKRSLVKNIGLMFGA